MDASKVVGGLVCRDLLLLLFLRGKKIDQQQHPNPWEEKLTDMLTPNPACF